jgi:glycine dehydrogenase subunit 1
MDVSNAGHYDGATALAEAVLMALHAAKNGSKRVLVPGGLHPEYLAVLRTYLAPAGGVIEVYDTQSPLPLVGGAGGGCAAVIACYPDFFGAVPSPAELSALADAAHAAGGLCIVHTDPIMLGLFKTPGELGADIVTAEGQCLGNDLNYGGPGLGIMAVRESLMRRIPGRIAGAACDAAGRRGFVLTLAAREQHIRREKAVSNICSNQGLAMLRAAIYLSLLCKNGLQSVARLCWDKSHYAAELLGKIPGCSVPTSPFFREFVLTLPKGANAEKISEKLFKKGIVAGLPLSRYYPDRPDELLIAVTERNSKAEIERFAQVLHDALDEIDF